MNSNRPLEPTSPGRSPSGPLHRILRLFSSIPLGIVLLSILFIYSSIGSAGILYPTAEGWVHEQMRQWRGLEMTEFEWFHWWPFKLLIALICLNITVATLRRIPLKPVNFGVWMIHTGLLTLAAGSVLYFSTKVEGDSPVTRRQVLIELPDGEQASMPAIPGNDLRVEGEDGPWQISIWSVDPQWEILSGDDKGKRTYKVSVLVQSSEEIFIRELLAGYPQYTEDLVRSDDPAQPFARAKKTRGKALVNEAMKLSLTYEPQEHIYLANNIRKSWALYLRDLGTEEWIERPIEGLPLYNDYIVSREDVWIPPSESDLEPKALRVEVPPADEDDPLRDTELRITSYLRHAQMQTRLVPGGSQINPSMTVHLSNEQGEAREYDLSAFDPHSNVQEEGRLQFEWVESEEQRQALAAYEDRVLTITIPGTDIRVEHTICETMENNPFLSFMPIEGADYAFRVKALHDDLPVNDRLVSLAIVEIRKGDTTFERWVTRDPSHNRDRPLDQQSAPGHSEFMPLDEGIEMTYDPGRRPTAPVLITAGPDPEDLRLQVILCGLDPRHVRLKPGEPVALSHEIDLTVTKYAPFTQSITRPAIVPREQRDRDARELFSMVKVEVPAGGVTRSVWVPYHHYATKTPNDTLRRYTYRPAVVELPGGRKVQMIFSRRRIPLPTPVVLEDFQLTTHVGGFTGRTSSIRNWTSMVRFYDEHAERWTEPRAVSVNEPVEHGGFWFFQSLWDPPMGPRFEGDRPSAGLNYTVLGVGNRNGVLIQLAGTILSVIGMIYAFYVKPIIRRRQRAAVYATVEAAPPAFNGELHESAARRVEQRRPEVAPGVEAPSEREHT